jgi:hypothetical protein
MPTGRYMWIGMYLRFHHAGAKIQDGGDPARKAPKLLLAIPVPACGLDDGVQRFLVRLSLNVHHLWRAGPDGLAAHKEFHGRVPYLALGVSSVPDADQRRSVAAREFDCSAISGSHCCPRRLYRRRAGDRCHRSASRVRRLFEVRAPSSRKRCCPRPSVGRVVRLAAPLASVQAESGPPAVESAPRRCCPRPSGAPKERKTSFNRGAGCPNRDQRTQNSTAKPVLDKSEWEPGS